MNEDMLVLQQVISELLEVIHNITKHKLILEVMSDYEVKLIDDKLNWLLDNDYDMLNEQFRELLLQVVENNRLLVFKVMN